MFVTWTMAAKHGTIRWQRATLEGVAHPRAKEGFVLSKSPTGPAAFTDEPIEDLSLDAVDDARTRLWMKGVASFPLIPREALPLLPKDRPRDPSPPLDPEPQRDPDP